MKKTRFLCLICAAAVAAACFTGCGSDNETTSVSDVQNAEEAYNSNSNETSSVGESQITEEAYYSNPFENADKTGWLDMSWFDDAVFIGDSITLKLSYYNDATFVLGNAQFVCAGSLGWGNALFELNDPGAVHPFYGGEYVLTENAIEASGANKALIGLGMNDVGLYGVDDSINNASELIDRIQSNSPNAVLYIESVTPMIESAQTESLNNDLLRQFNSELEVLAQEKGCYYLNTHEVFVDSKGNLPLSLCSDPEELGIHFTNEACEIWIDYLRSHISE